MNANRAISTLNSFKNAIKRMQSVTSDWDFLQSLVEGVKVKEIKNVPKPGGFVTEVFRRDWKLDKYPVDQVFQVTLEPGVISAWHAHEKTIDRLFVNQGMVKIVLFDGRKNSNTYGQVNVFRAGETRPTLIVIPPLVWHGVQNISSKVSRLLNMVDHAYKYEDPDHWELPYDSDEIPYNFIEENNKAL